MLQTGDAAPLFAAESSEGPVDLREIVGKRPVVIIFYPNDETMLCTKQLCNVRDSKRQYAEYDALVMGVNWGSLDKHRDFSEHHGFDFPLVSDPDFAINRMYDVGLTLFTRRRQKRIVYVIGLDGTIRYAQKGNRPTGEILAALKNI